eukprot:Gb_12306 [translate_table: standard]
MAAAAPAAIPPPPCTQSESQSQSHSKPKRRRRRETTITTTATGFEPRTTTINATTSYDNSTATKVRRAPQAVTTEGAWCCVAKPISSPSPPPPRRTNSSSSKSREQPQSEETARPTEAEEPRVAEPNKENQRTAAENTAQKPNTNGEAKCERSKSGDILKSGEIAALIKQGFIPDKNVSINGNGNTSPFRIRLSPGRVSPIMDSASFSSLGYPPGYGKFNSVLNAGLLNPSSSPPVEKIRSSPTLFEMMAHEQEMLPKQHPIPTTNSATNAPQIFHCQSNGKQPSVQDKQLLIQERMSTILSCCSPGSQFNDADSSDVKLTLSSKDGLSVTMNVHRQILVAHSRFFAAKLSERWSKQQRTLPHLVEISDCDDVEVYMETLRLMYCKDLKRKLMKENVSKVLGILKVSAAIVFDAGMLSCLEYLEAVPWAEEEEEKVASLLMQLQLDSIGAGEVLKRISIEDTNTGGSEEVLVKLLQLVLKGTDEKARKEMKALVSRMLRENAAQCKDSFDVSKESLYHACHDCLDSLLHHFMQATSTDIMGRASEDRGSIVNQIARQSDNLHWLLDILIDRQIADDFVRMWANQAELAALHSKIPTMYRYEVSRLTARLCIALGRGQVLVPKDVRFSLLQTWLQPMFDDFGWMRRACKALDRKVVEDGISQTILTLPLKQQQNILLSWFDRFLNNGDDCPNLQRAFEVWWRRTYVRPCSEGDQNQLQIAPYN